MDFRFLAALGMTGRRGWIIATIPFCLPLSAPERGRDFLILGTLLHTLSGALADLLGVFEGFAGRELTDVVSVPGYVVLDDVEVGPCQGP